MQESATTMSFIASPTGEGKWYATREYHALNCLVEEITLRHDPVKHQIESPFGLLNVTQQDGQVIYNHNTIVWGNITSKTSSVTTLFHGQAYLEVAHPDIDISTSRLVDTQRQVEISFHNIPDQYNVELSPVFSVGGMPKTFLQFPMNTTNALYKVYKNIIILCNDTQKAESQLCKDTLTLKVKWDRHHQLKRSIKNQIKFLSKEDEELTEGKRLYSISYTWGTITLKDEVDLTTNYLPGTIKSLQKLYMFYSPNPMYN